jgi:glucarate dehydratase
MHDSTGIAPVAEIAEFDRRTVADIRRRQALIDDVGRAARLRIRDVRTWRVLMPWTGTKRWDGSAETFTFAEFITDQGLSAISEGSPDDPGLRDRVVGADPFDPRLRADLGLAYWDFFGKVVDKPLHRALRDVFELDVPTVERVPMAAYTWRRFPDLHGRHEVTFDSYPQHLQELVRTDGFRILKISMCDFEPHRYIELVHAARAAVGPDVEIRVDPHASWSESQALHFMRQVESCRLEWIEEPVGGSFENIFRAGHRLRQMSSVPISSHAWLPPLLPPLRPAGGRYGDESLDQPLDLDALRRFRAADISAPDAYAGPLALKRFFDVARFTGMDIGMHSAYELGPGTAVRLHIAAFAFPYRIPYHIVWGGITAPFALHGLDSHYNQWEGDVIRGGKLRYENGCLAVPQGPGLGVALDPDLLEHYRWTDEKFTAHQRHIEQVRDRHLEKLGWRRGRMGW